jgi:hypothetical protein
LIFNFICCADITFIFNLKKSLVLNQNVLLAKIMVLI